uniref:Conserved oligomeric Golgi complex subunit 1 n=1 Tax=Palpitomonas bilix TaxID=652834 RepID=A0A7S3GI90_9EUKA|mmetsp:Transcript_5044/g.10949  ORF Transcript_5044/g.10949 Transcript_5044/m.10949 type:complete len:807 (+) Transcript_5044:119-2539(+)
MNSVDEFVSGKLSPSELVDNLLTSCSLPQLQLASRRLQQEEAGRKGELRTVLGARYEELIDASEQVEKMKDGAAEFSSLTSAMNSALSELKHGLSLFGDVIGASEDDAPRGLSVSSRVEDASCMIEVLLDAPGRIWGYIDQDEYLHAIVFLHHCTALHAKLEQTETDDVKELMARCLFLSEQMDTLSQFEERVKRSAEEYLCEESEEALKISGALACVGYLSNMDGGSLVDLFLRSRQCRLEGYLEKGRFETLVDSNTSSPKDAQRGVSTGSIVQFFSVLADTLDAIGHIFGNSRTDVASMATVVQHVNKDISHSILSSLPLLSLPPFKFPATLASAAVKSGGKLERKAALWVGHMLQLWKSKCDSDVSLELEDVPGFIGMLLSCVLKPAQATTSSVNEKRGGKAYQKKGWDVMRGLYSNGFECPSARSVFSTYILPSIEGSIVTAVRSCAEGMYKLLQETLQGNVPELAGLLDMNGQFDSLVSVLSTVESVNKSVNEALESLYGESEADDLLDTCLKAAAVAITREAKSVFDMCLSRLQYVAGDSESDESLRVAGVGGKANIALACLAFFENSSAGEGVLSGVREAALRQAYLVQYGLRVWAGRIRFREDTQDLSLRFFRKLVFEGEGFTQGFSVPTLPSQSLLSLLSWADKRIENMIGSQNLHQDATSIVAGACAQSFIMTRRKHVEDGLGREKLWQSLFDCLFLSSLCLPLQDDVLESLRLLEQKIKGEIDEVEYELAVDTLEMTAQNAAARTSLCMSSIGASIPSKLSKQEEWTKKLILLQPPPRRFALLPAASVDGLSEQR